MRSVLVLAALLVLAAVPLAGAAPQVYVCAGKVGVQPCPGVACVWTGAKATCVPQPSGAPDRVCRTQRAGEGSTTTCVQPTRPDCLIETTTWTGADGWTTCTGL